MECPFCGSKLKLESAKNIPRVRFVMYCENDDCSIQPCTDYGAPSEVIAEAELFGKIKID